MVVVQNIPTFKGRGIRTTNSTRSQQIDIQNMIEAKKRKDYIKRQILHILNFSSISNHPPEQPSSVRPPQKAKKYTPDHSILSEPAAFSNDTSCMQFPIPVEYFDKNVQLKNGDIKVFIRVKNKKNKRKKKVSLKISLITESKKSVTIASRKFKLRKTAWQHIHLPATLIKSIQRQHMDVLKICIHCNKCKRKVKIELPTRPNTKRKKKRKNKNGRRRRKQRVPKLRKNRPKLLLYSKSTEVSVRNRRHVPSECDSKCCKRAQFIPFNSLHLPQEIEFPKGFLYELCTTLCSENDASKQSHDVKECKSVRKDPLNLDIKFKDGIQFNLSIPNAKVSTCQCHIQ